MKFIIILFLTINILIAETVKKNDKLEIKRMIEETTLPVKKIYKKYTKKNSIFIEKMRFNIREGRIYSLLNNNHLLYDKKELYLGKNIQTFDFNDNNEFFFIEKNKYYISKVSPSKTIINKTRIEKKFGQEELFTYSSNTEILDMTFYERKKLLNKFYILHTNRKTNKSYISLIDSKGNILSNIKIGVDNASSIYYYNNEFLVTTKYGDKLYKLNIDGEITNEYVINLKNIKDFMKIGDELYFSVDNNYYIYLLKENILGVYSDEKQQSKPNKKEVTNVIEDSNSFEENLNEIENRIRNEYNHKNRQQKNIKKPQYNDIKESEIDYELDKKIEEYQIDLDVDYDEIFQKR